MKREYRVVSESIAKRILFLSNECRAVTNRMMRDQGEVEKTEWFQILHLSEELGRAQAELAVIAERIGESL